MHQFESVLKDELSFFLEQRKLSKSKSAYDHDKHTLRIFDEYLIDINCMNKEITEEQLAGWIRTLPGKSNTVANKAIVIRLFLEHLRNIGIHAFIPPIPKVRDDYVPYIFSDSEVEKLFSISDTLPKGRPKKYKLIRIEYPMILRLMYGCGLRVGETLSLRMKDVDIESGILALRNTKNDKQRITPMHKTLTEILRQYCMAMGIVGCPESFLFPAINQDDHLKPHVALHRFEYILKLAGITLPGRKKHQRGPCLHCIRHVFVFKSFKNAEGNGRRIDDLIPYLSIYLGHDSLNETDKYLKFSSEMFPEAMNLFDEYTVDIFSEVNFDELSV